MTNDVELAKPQTFAMDTIARAANAYEVWENAELFTQLQRGATLLAKSQLVPKAFQGEEHIADCFLGLAIARATQQDPVMVLQNLYVANGRAGWYSKYMIARANASGIFDGVIRFKAEDLGEIEAIQKVKTGWDQQERRPTYKETKHKVRNISVTAFANLKNVKGDSYVEQTVTMQMASDDGWTQNEKYFTIPQRMLEWRAASWLINLYAPHILFGLPTAEEIQDVSYEVIHDDPMDRVASGSRPQIADYAPQEGAGAAPAPAAAQATGGRRKGARGAQSAPAAQASPPPPPAEEQSEPKEPTGTVGGAQMEGNDEPSPADDPVLTGGPDPEPPHHILTIVNAAGTDFTYKIPDQQEKALKEWAMLVNSLKGAGYSPCEQVWNANKAEITRMGEAGWPGLLRTMQDAISGMASAEKKREKAEAAAQAGKPQETPPADPPSATEPEPSSTGSDAESGEPEGEPEPLMFVTDDGEVHEFDADADAEKWLHQQITSLSADDLASFYEANQALMDELGFGVVVEKQQKALASAKAPVPTATPAAAGKRFHPAVKPVEAPNNDAKLAFAALSKVLDELRGDNAPDADYAELARLNEAVIGHIKSSLKQWFNTMAKRFSAKGVTV